MVADPDDLVVGDVPRDVAGRDRTRGRRDRRHRARPHGRPTYGAARVAGAGGIGRGGGRHTPRPGVVRRGRRRRRPCALLLGVADARLPPRALGEGARRLPADHGRADAASRVAVVDPHAVPAGRGRRGAGELPHRPGRRDPPLLPGHRGRSVAAVLPSRSAYAAARRVRSWRAAARGPGGPRADGAADFRRRLPRTARGSIPRCRRSRPGRPCSRRWRAAAT